MKLLAVHPSCLMYSKIYLRLEPLGLELVAAAARRAGHTVRLIDLQCEPHQNFFHLVKRWQPNVIAFSVNYLANVPEVIDLARAARALLPETFICVGGHSVSFIPEEILRHAAGAVDCGRRSFHSSRARHAAWRSDRPSRNPKTILPRNAWRRAAA